MKFLFSSVFRRYLIKTTKKEGWFFFYFDICTCRIHASSVQCHEISLFFFDLSSTIVIWASLNTTQDLQRQTFVLCSFVHVLDKLATFGHLHLCCTPSEADWRRWRNVLIKKKKNGLEHSLPCTLFQSPDISLRSKRFQSSYCAKIGVRAKNN